MEENTIECPNCGDVFSLELTRCPQCGLNLYPEEEEAPTPSFPPPANSPLKGGESGETVLGVVLGWILAGAVSFVMQMFASRALTAEDLPPGWKVAVLLACPLGALLGGYAMGAVGQHSRPRGAGLGLLVGAGCAALVVLYETRWRLVTWQVVVEASMLAQYALCVLGGALGGWLNGKSEAVYLAGGAPEPEREAKGMSWEDLMYRDLLTRVRYNRDTAERLIEYERRLAPEADRYTLLRNAVDRLDRDRRD